MGTQQRQRRGAKHGTCSTSPFASVMAMHPDATYARLRIHALIKHADSGFTIQHVRQLLRLGVFTVLPFLLGDHLETVGEPLEKIAGVLPFCLSQKHGEHKLIFFKISSSLSSGKSSVSKALAIGNSAGERHSTLRYPASFSCVLQSSGEDRGTVMRDFEVARHVSMF